MSAHEIAEKIEHVAHEGHSGHSGGNPRLGTYVGVTMACLGVMLAYAAAKVGAERTELVQTLVEQQNAHAKYQAQNIKYRMAVLTLESVHAGLPADSSSPGAPRKTDVLMLAETVERYFKEAEAAKEWVETFDPAIQAHVKAQEEFERGQLFAEIGIVVASVALLLHRSIAWYLALAIALGAVVTLVLASSHVTSVIHEAEHHIEEKGKIYRELRSADKTTAAEDELVLDTKKWAGATTPAKTAPAHD